MYRRILIVLDRHPQARAALRAGLQVAHAHEAEATLLALQARLPVATPDSIPPMPVPNDEFERAAKADANRALAAAHQAAARAGVMSRGLLGRGEDDAAQVVEVARRRRAELIVLPCEDLNALMRLLTGSLVPALITASPVPLLVCKSDTDEAGPDWAAEAGSPAGDIGKTPCAVTAPAAADPTPPVRMLVVLEARPGAAAAVIREGLRVAQVERAEVVFVPSGHEPREGRGDAATLCAGALAAATRAGVAARCDELDPAPTPQAIAAHACELGCRLIVVASEGRNAVTRLLAGSLAPRLITAAAAMPVLVCRDVEPGSRERPAARRPRRTAPPAA